MIEYPVGRQRKYLRLLSPPDKDILVFGGEATMLKNNHPKKETSICHY